MANPEHLAILKQGGDMWNEWRQRNPHVRPDLSAVDLREFELRGYRLTAANLSNANLRESKLKEAKLNGAFLIATDLFGSDLSGADLRAANLGAADLRFANLHGALLDFANLSFSYVRGADFSEAVVSRTLFADLDLWDAKGLVTVLHSASSTIGIDTIYKSAGHIPATFLRGCGVPDQLIEFIDKIKKRPIEYYSCFISYSTKDQTFADRLYADLQAKGVRCWFAPHDIMGGRKIHEQIDEAIRVHDKLLLILSEQSMASDWVGTEIANAREREAREKKQLLFPITIAPFEDVKKWKLFDADRGKDSAREIREYFIPDFSRWKEHDSYQAALEGLVKGLKAG